MAKYFIVKINGHQYKVADGQEILVDQLKANEGDIIDIPEVLLAVDDEKIEIGQPILKDGLKAKILGGEKGNKIRVSRFKAKSRYDKVRGFRAKLTKIQILTSAPKKEVKKEEEVAPKKEETKKVAKKATSKKATS